MKQIKVINYGLSNLLSVQRAFEHLGAQVEFVNTPEGVLAAEALVLPGVGAFKDGMAGLERLGLVEPILQKAAAGTPLLGICLGMQMLFDESDEFGLYKGLGLIPGRVEKIPALDTDGDPQRVPHISWNGLWPAGGRTDFAGTRWPRSRPGRNAISYTATRQSPQMRPTAWPTPATAAAPCAPPPPTAAYWAASFIRKRAAGPAFRY